MLGKGAPGGMKTPANPVRFNEARAVCSGKACDRLADALDAHHVASMRPERCARERDPR